MLAKLAWCQEQRKYNLWLLNNQEDHFVSDILYSLVKLTRELVFSYTGNVRKCYFFFVEFFLLSIISWLYTWRNQICF